MVKRHKKTTQRITVLVNIDVSNSWRKQTIGNMVEWSAEPSTCPRRAGQARKEHRETTGSQGKGKAISTKMNSFECFPQTTQKMNRTWWAFYPDGFLS